MKKSFGPMNIDTSASQPPSSGGMSLNELIAKEAELAKREGALEEREKILQERQKLLDSKLEQLESLRQDLIEKLQRISQLSVDEAKQLLLENLEKKLAAEISQRIKQAEDEIKERAEEKAREILAEAMLHGVTDYVAEFTTSTINLEDEEIKGRIIGKEGRNIKTFEQATGVDVVMDESPDTLVLSSFDPVRREIARVALERLIADGRIQPQRIEEVVAKTREDIEKLICQAGEELCYKLGVYNMPREIVCLLGRFKYRFSYGQNMIQHTLEETQIGMALARSLGADVNVVRLACLLHDIGKVLVEGDEGTHVEKGVQLLRKYNFPEKVIRAVAEHHEDEPFSSVESVIVYIADAISGSRPGARHENIQEYIKRMEDIEKIATSFEGVEKAFALQAGREVRVIVIPDKVSDEELPKLVHDIGERIQQEVIVPGAVKVTAIRESRYSESFITQ